MPTKNETHIVETFIASDEVILNREFVEEVWQLAYGADAWEREVSAEEVLQKLKQFEAHALKWEEQEGLL